MQKLWLQLVENSGPERKKFRTRLKRDAVFGQGLDNNYSQSTFSPTQTSTISQTQTSTTSQTQTSTLTTGTYNLGEEVASVSGPDVGTINGDKIEQTGAAEDRQDTSEIQSERMTAITDSQHGNTIPGSDSNVFTSSPEIAMYSEGNDKEGERIRYGLQMKL